MHLVFLDRLIFARTIRGRSFGAGDYYDAEGEPLDAVGYLYDKFATHPIGDPEHVSDWWWEVIRIPVDYVNQMNDTSPAETRGDVVASILLDGAPLAG